MSRATLGNTQLFKLFLFVVVLSGTALCMHPAAAAPSPELWPRWQTQVSDSTQIVDHSPWDIFLEKYLVTNHPSGINRLRYGNVTSADHQALDGYLVQLQHIRVSQLNRNEQKSYWVNLYNALTVKVVLDHYPVKSITDIDISPGFFSNGPWDAKLLRIEGEKVSLNDIEHRVLRPIFRDNRLHYALNCASLGCPNLQPVAYTASNMEKLLEKGSKAYINHPRGARIISGKLQVSSIYKWFQVDFGDSEQGVIRHLLKYAQGSLADKLRSYKNNLSYDYEWSLNIN